MTASAVENLTPGLIGYHQCVAVQWVPKEDV